MVTVTAIYRPTALVTGTAVVTPAVAVTEMVKVVGPNILQEQPGVARCSAYIIAAELKYKAGI